MVPDQGGYQWIRERDPSLPPGFCRLICMKDGRRMKLTKFEEVSSGNKFNRLEEVSEYLESNNPGNKMRKMLEEKFSSPNFSKPKLKATPLLTIDDDPLPESISNLTCCGLQFGSAELKRRHMTQAHGRGISSVNINQDRSRIEKFKYHKCELCQKMFKLPEQLKQHQSAEHPRNQINDLVLNINNLKVGNRNISITPSVEPGTECEICGFETKTKRAMQNHLEDHKKQERDMQILQSNSNQFIEGGGSNDDVEVLEEDERLSDEDDDEIEMEEIYSDVDPSVMEVTLPKEDYAEVKSTNEDIYEYDEFDDYDEDDDEDFEKEPEEITLDDGPEEITLDEDAETSEEEISVLDPRVAEQNKREEYNNLMRNSEEIFRIIDDQQLLEKLQMDSWYAKPIGWKPSSPGESWHGNVKQITQHFKLHDISLAKLTSEEKRGFHRQDLFLKWVLHKLTLLNQGKSMTSIYRLAKAKWFQLLEPVIPVEMATIDDEIDD